MKIVIDLNDNYRVLLKEDLLKLAQRAARLCLLKKNIHLAVTLITDEQIRNLNRKYRHKDKVTDVLSFSFQEQNSKNKFIVVDSELDNIGEIYISKAQANRQAKEVGHELDRELKILFIHGLLHLLGYDHKLQKEAVKMEKLEREIIK